MPASHERATQTPSHLLRLLVPASLATFAPLSPSCVENRDDDPGEVPQGSAEAPPGADGLTSPDREGAFPGFGVAISVSGDDVVLDWSATAPQGGAVSVYRSPAPTPLASFVAGSPLPPGVEEFTLAAGTMAFTDAGAADRASLTPPFYYYRVGVQEGSALELSTMVMKATTAMAPGYNKFGLCMLGGPTHASDVAERLGSSVTGVWGWDAASQAYVSWNPEQDAGSAADFALPFGGVVAAEVDGSTPSYQTLTGVVPTNEAFAVSAQSGYNWSTFPPLYSGPTQASYWVGEAGYLGMGQWNNLTQRARWYWDATYGDFELDPCRPHYTYLPDTACASTEDCGEDKFCFFVDAAACGGVGAGLCTARPMGCEFAQHGMVCGCDGTVYASACEAELAGVSVNTGGSCVIGESVETVGPEGGLLEAGGVSIEIPVGALESSSELTLSVAIERQYPLVSVSPHITFATPALVTISPELWSPTVPSYAFHRAPGAEDQHIDDITTDPAGTYFSTFSFPTNGASNYDIARSNEVAEHYRQTDWQYTRNWRKGTILTWDKQTDSIMSPGDHSRPNADICYHGNSAENKRCNHIDDCNLVQSHLVGMVQGQSPAFHPIAAIDAADTSVSRQCGGSRPVYEALFMTPELAGAVTNLSEEVRNFDFANGETARLWLNAGYDSTGKMHTPASPHYTGRAVDLDLCTLQGSVCNSKVPDNNPKLDELADLTFRTFVDYVRSRPDLVDARVNVFHEGNHVHAAITVRCAAPRAQWNGRRCIDECQNDAPQWNEEMLECQPSYAMAAMCDNSLCGGSDAMYTGIAGFYTQYGPGGNDVDLFALGSSYSGNRVGDTVSFSGSYGDSGVTIDEAGSVQLSADETSFTGNTWWSLSGNGLSCGGTCAFEGGVPASIRGALMWSGTQDPAIGEAVCVIRDDGDGAFCDSWDASANECILYDEADGYGLCALTDVNGEYMIEGLPPGDYLVATGDACDISGWTSIQVESGESVQGIIGDACP